MHLEKSVEIMLQSTPIAYAFHKVIFDKNSNIISYKTLDYNQAFLNIAGIDMTKSNNQSIDEFIYIIKNEIPEVESAILNTITKKESTTMFGYTSTYDKWLKLHLFPTDENHFIVQITDISREKELEDKLRYRSQELQLILNSINDLVLVVNFDQIIVEANNAWKKLLDYEPNEVIGKYFYEFLTKEIYEKVLSKFKDGSLFDPDYILKTNIPKKDGSLITVEWKTSIYDDYVYSVGRDITPLVKTQEEIRYLSYHDKLTGLYNRAFFEEELKRLDNDRNLPLSIIMGDINGLKIINDVFGHLAGDNLLKKISNILSSSLRKGDILSRWGGDEFIILLPHTSEKITKDIISRIKLKCEDNKSELQYGSISLGYGIKKSAKVEAMDILAEAESNMYRNKALESKQTRYNIISSMMDYLYYRKYEDKSRIDQIKTYLRKMAKKLNLPKEYIDNLICLAEFHDIGLVSVPKEILDKKDKLSDTDWKKIKNHPEAGYRIAKVTPELTHIANNILYHQEMWDGNGYPHGLKGEEIPFLNRIFSVVDVYYALTQDKPYRPSLTHEEAIDILKTNKGSSFDPELVDLFLKILKMNNFNI